MRLTKGAVNLGLMDRLRQRTYEILEDSKEEDSIGRFCDAFLVIIISLNVLAVILESVSALHSAYSGVFHSFEVFSVTVFSIEYLARLWACTKRPGLKYHHPVWGRLRYMASPMAILDLVVILPFFLAMMGAVDLRFLRVLRLLRVFRLTRYSSALRLLTDVLKDEAANIGAALFILMMMVVLSASLVYLAEVDAQPDAFGSIPDALWWAIITMTSIGYGDVVPVTNIGKIFGAIIGIISVGMVALPTGIIASGFNQALHQRKQEYSELIDAVLANGTITEEEHERLHETRERLGLSDREAAAILNSAHHNLKKMPMECPHCGKAVSSRPAPKGV